MYIYVSVWIDIFDSSLWFSVAKRQSLIVWDIYNRLFFFQASGFYKQYNWEFRIRDCSDISVKCLPHMHEHLRLICRPCEKARIDAVGLNPSPGKALASRQPSPIGKPQVSETPRLKDQSQSLLSNNSQSPLVSTGKWAHIRRSDWLWAGAKRVQEPSAHRARGQY